MMLMDLYGKAKTLVMATVICGIKIFHFLSPRFLGFFHVESHQKFLVLLKQSVLGVTWRQLNLGKDLSLAVMYQRNRVLFLYPPLLNHIELNSTNQKNNFMTILQAIPGMKRMMHLITRKRAKSLHLRLGKIVNEERWSEILYSLLGQVCRTISIWYWYREEIFHWQFSPVLNVSS